MNVQAIEAFLSQEFANPNLRFEVSRRDRTLFVFVTAPHLRHPEAFASLVYAALTTQALAEIDAVQVLDGTNRPLIHRWQRSFQLPPAPTASSLITSSSITPLLTTQLPPQPSSQSLPPPLSSPVLPTISPEKLSPEKRAALRRRSFQPGWVVALLALGLLGIGLAQRQAWLMARVIEKRADSVVVPLVPLLVGDRAAILALPEFKTPPTRLDLHLAFFGDIFWGRYINDWSAQSGLGTAYPFSKLDTIGKREGEYWIGNLECPVTTVQTTSAQQEARLKFNCLPDYLPQAAQWFDAFSLANNHTDNWNEYDGFTVTKGFLENHNLPYFGHHNNQLDETCKVLDIPAQHNGDRYRLPVALCGYHGVFRRITPEEISLISAYAPYMPVVAMPHTGAEYTTNPGSIKVETYRAMIDAGADMVIGGHPHAVQSTEAYQGKLIVYSQGNFLFDQQRGIMRTTHLGIRAQLAISDPVYIRAATQLPDHCFNTYTLCPEIQASLAKPTYQIRYEPFYTANPERIPRIAFPGEVNYINQMSNIERTLTQLQ